MFFVLKSTCFVLSLYLGTVVGQTVLSNTNLLLCPVLFEQSLVALVLVIFKPKQPVTSYPIMWNTSMWVSQWDLNGLHLLQDHLLLLLLFQQILVQPKFGHL